MQWSDDALVITARRHGETSTVLELMTRDHGRHLGLVHGGRSRRLRPVLQPGNGVHAVWRARLDEQLGTYVVEGGALRAARLIGSPLALYGIAALSALLRLLPERDPHPVLFESASLLLDHLDDAEVAAALFVRFELLMLTELGFGLDLASCAATGATDNLAYVSPKSGRAVSAGAGAPYTDRLFALPAFLAEAPWTGSPDRKAVEAGFAITSHFLRLHIFEPRGQTSSEERERFIALATRRDA